MATAPQAIFDVFNQVQRDVPAAVLSGIVGDVRHSFGYHLARNELPGNDYSVVLPLDRQGDSGCASALDISLPPGQMIAVTNRLLNAARVHDPRMAGVREFCGTTDGAHTHPYDLSNGQDGPLDSWDASHLWHVHISFYRAYANNSAVINRVVSVIAGTGDSTSSGKTKPITAPEDSMFEIIQLKGSPASTYAWSAGRWTLIHGQAQLQQLQRSGLATHGGSVRAVSNTELLSIRSFAIGK